MRVVRCDGVEFIVSDNVTCHIQLFEDANEDDCFPLLHPISVIKSTLHEEIVNIAKTERYNTHHHHFKTT